MEKISSWSGQEICPFSFSELQEKIQQPKLRRWVDFSNQTTRLFTGVLSLQEREAVNQGLAWVCDPMTFDVVQEIHKLKFHSLWDMCASPGTKSLLLRKFFQHPMPDLHVLTEINQPRFTQLKKNVQMAGLEKSVCIQKFDARSAWSRPFEAILLDTPCSGQTLAKSPPRCFQRKTEKIWAKQSRQLLENAGRQSSKYIFFVTCTLGVIENEEVIHEFTAHHEHWSLVSFHRRWPDETTRGGTWAFLKKNNF